MPPAAKPMPRPATVYATPAAPRHRPGRDVKSVSDVNAEARFLVEERFGVVWIAGEVSDFRAYASGHWYFTLKDRRAQLRCVMFASRNRFLRFLPTDGLAVVLRARLSLYEARGDFQALVDHIEGAGEGALRIAFDALRAQLSTEGLFAAERKRPLPRFPRHIAVVSSRDGAALRDVLAVLRRRFPCVRATCFHVAVQGPEAAGQIIGALDRMERMRQRPDVAILTRGGGSLEDLAAFNQEVVARRIHAAAVPIISAVGHETDTTIADFVADRRAATPTAAAELATPDRADLERGLAAQAAGLRRQLALRLQADRQLLAATRRRLVHPARALEQRLLRTDELSQRLTAAMTATLRRLAMAQRHQRALLARANPLPRLQATAQRVAARQAQAAAGVAAGLDRRRRQVDALARALHAVSPLATLERGYAVVAVADGSRWGKPVVAAAGAQAGSQVTIHWADGSRSAHIDDAKHDAP